MRVYLGLGVVLLTAACGSDGLSAPPCAQDLCYVETIGGGMGEGEEGGNLNHAFVNALDGVGYLTIDDGTAGNVDIRIEFTELVANGDSVSARGHVKIWDYYDIGNCETGGYPGHIGVDDDGNGWTFTLNDLHDPPYCSGAALDGSFAAAFRSGP